MSKKQQGFVEMLERKRREEVKQSEFKASNRNNEPLHNPNNIEPEVRKMPPGKYEVTGKIIGGFATAGIGRYLEA